MTIEDGGDYDMTDSRLSTHSKLLVFHFQNINYCKAQYY